MKKEFNLSEKKKIMYGLGDVGKRKPKGNVVYPEKHIKEFIKKLKEVSKIYDRRFCYEIDKLAGKI